MVCKIFFRVYLMANFSEFNFFYCSDPQMLARMYLQQVGAPREVGWEADLLRVQTRSFEKDKSLNTMAKIIDLLPSILLRLRWDNVTDGLMPKPHWPKVYSSDCLDTYFPKLNRYAYLNWWKEIKPGTPVEFVTRDEGTLQDKDRKGVKTNDDYITTEDGDGICLDWNNWNNRYPTATTITTRNEDRIYSKWNSSRPTEAIWHIRALPKDSSAVKQALQIHLIPPLANIALQYYGNYCFSLKEENFANVRQRLEGFRI